MESKEITKPVRQFLPQEITIDSWAKIETYYKDLEKRSINSTEELKKWLLDRSELEAVLSEDMGWRYIKMTCDTTNEELTKSFTFFVEEIEPNIAPY